MKSIDEISLKESSTYRNRIFISVPGPRFFRVGNDGLEIVNMYESEMYDILSVVGIDII